MISQIEISSNNDMKTVDDNCHHEEKMKLYLPLKYDFSELKSY